MHALQTTMTGVVASLGQAPAVATTNPETPQLSDQTRDVINRVFFQLQAVIPAWRHALPTDEHISAAKQQWLKTLFEGGIHEQAQISRGFHHIRRSGVVFWPTPWQFVEWCNGTSETLEGVPAVGAAYEEFCCKSHDLQGATFSHPIVRSAGKAAGVWEMRNLPRNKAFPIFERAFGLLRDRLIAGDDLGEELPKALPEETFTPLSRGENQSRLQALRAAL